MIKMELSSFLKCMAKFSDLISVSISPKVVVLLPKRFDEKLEDFTYRIGKEKVQCFNYSVFIFP